jgi:hypothetical protein
MARWRFWKNFLRRCPVVTGVILEGKLGIALSLLRTLLPIIPDHY